MQHRYDRYRPTVISLCAFVSLLLLSFTALSQTNSGITFDGSNDYVTFGSATTQLGVTQFTLEAWVKRAAGGATMTTGSLGLDGSGTPTRPKAYPVLTKGMGEGESPANINMNFFLGITETGFIGADFEDNAGGVNHPVWGVTTVPIGVWTHIAATYDGQTWKLYFNGILDKTLTLASAFTPESGSIQHAALGAGLNSSGGLATGYFSGSIDEPRVWGVVRTQAEIQAAMNMELVSGTGLKGRWGLNEGTGTAATNSVAGSVNGTLMNGPVWGSGMIFPSDARGLAFSGSTPNTYVKVNDAAGLALANYTIECWFRREGTGTTTSTGTNGVLTVIPLVTKGTSENESPANININYFLGIDDATDVLCADFEEATGPNHPLLGTTTLQNNVWYHAAFTFDGTTLCLYLNGVLESSTTSANPCASTTISPVAFGSSLRSNGTSAQGFFIGSMDEVRIWNNARSAAEIGALINAKVTTAQPGLVGRWGLDDGTGAAVASGAGTAFNGTIVNANYAWVVGAPFNLLLDPPAAPSALTAIAGRGNQIRLTWTDNSTNETGFQIERSPSGDAGTYSFLAAATANQASYVDAGLSLNTPYYYRIRAVKDALSSAYSAAAHATTPSAANNGLNFGGTNTYVTFGAAPGLATQTFTVEAWFMKTGAGVSNTTGSNGITIIPIIAKGAPEADASIVDENYILGINSATGTIAVDFEEGTGSTTPGSNHPLTGTTVIQNNVWYHAAATYGAGGEYRLYLNGNLEASASLTAAVYPQGSTTQHSSLGTMITSAAAPLGYFAGTIDEARIWNYARTQDEIRSTINAAITASQAGLLARWGCDELSGTVVPGSAGTSFTGTITNSPYAWVEGAPFSLPVPPALPVLVAPALGTITQTSLTLTTAVSDNSSTTLSVKFMGRMAGTAPSFMLVDLPDSQNYSATYPAIFSSQTQAIRDNAAAMNIRYVVHTGDIVNDGAADAQWTNAGTSLGILEAPMTGYPNGIPYGMGVGNHDQMGGTTKFNNTFGVSRFEGRSYYGGHYGSDNLDHYDLFSASGMDFIVVYIRSEASAAEIAWADGVIAANPARRAILASHNMINTGNPGTFTAQGQAIYDAVKDNANLFLMLCGHVAGAGRRTDTFNGHTITTLLADYQDMTNGGNGYLRTLEFVPSANQINVKTYSPYAAASLTDAANEFTVPYTMTGSGAETFTELSTVSAANNSNASYVWSGLQYAKTYEWYVEVTDGDGNTTTGPVWTFTTEELLPVELSSFSASVNGSAVSLRWTTATEVNNYGFEIERLASNSAGAWTKVGFVQGNGSTNAARAYAFTDHAGAGTYSYRLKQIDRDGSFSYSSQIEASVKAQLAQFELEQNYPNPFNPATTISFGLPKDGRTTLVVYDMLGREVTTLVNEVLQAGRHTVKFNASALSSGIYIYKLSSGSFSAVRKFSLMK